MKMTEKEFNVLTNEESITEREMTAAELAERQAAQAQAAAKAQAEAEAQAKRSVALAKLEALGLNEADLKALGF
jgi:uncharacterized membrane protein